MVETLPRRSMRASQQCGPLCPHHCRGGAPPEPRGLRVLCDLAGFSDEQPDLRVGVAMLSDNLELFLKAVQ